MFFPETNSEDSDKGKVKSPVIDFSKYEEPATAPKAPASAKTINFDDVDAQEREMARSIALGAKELGIDPEDYATAMSFETAGTFDPWQKGGIKTRYGIHRGTIQYGEPQRKDWGVYEGQSFHEQVTKSNVGYLRKHGVKEGSTYDQIYKAINAGNANASDNVKDHGNTERSLIDRGNRDHRPAVRKRFGKYFSDPTLLDGIDGQTSSPVQQSYAPEIGQPIPDQFVDEQDIANGLKAPMTAPESPATLNAQRKSAALPTSPRVGTLYTPGDLVSMRAPEATETDIPLKDGRVLRADSAKLQAFLADNKNDVADIISGKVPIADLIAKVENVGNATTGSVPAVKTTAPDGTELAASAVTTPEAAQMQIVVDQAQFPGSQSQVVNGQDVIDGRQPLVLTDAQGRTFTEFDDQTGLQPDEVRLMPVGVENKSGILPIAKKITAADGTVSYQMPGEQSEPATAQGGRTAGQAASGTVNFDVDPNDPGVKAALAAQANDPNAKAITNQGQSIDYLSRVQELPTQWKAAEAKPILDENGNPRTDRNGKPMFYSPKPLTDDEMLKTVQSFQVDLTGVNGDKTAFASRAAAKMLGQRYGLTAEQVDSLAAAGFLEGQVSPDATAIIIDTPRSVIAKYAGLEKVKAAYDMERADPTIAMSQGASEADAKRKATAPNYADVSTSDYYKPTGDPLMDEARRIVTADPLSKGDDAAIAAEYERLKKYALSPEQEAEAIRVGRDSPEVAGERVSAFGSGVMAAGGRILESLAGMARIASNSPLDVTHYLPEEWITAISKEGKKLSLASATEAKANPGILNSAIRIAGTLPGDLARLAVLSRLPGGGTAMFATDMGLQSAGRGERTSQVVSETTKGAVLGQIFKVGSKVATAVENGTLRAFANPVFDAGKTATPIERLAAKVFGEGAKLGTIGLGTAYEARVNSKAATAEEANAEAINAGITMALTSLVLDHGPDIAAGIKAIAGKIFRVNTPEGVKNVVVTPSGEVKLLKGAVPEKMADVEMVMDPTDSVYKAKTDLPQKNLKSAPPKRIEKPIADAVQRIAIDSRANKIADILKDGQVKTVDEIQKASRYNRGKVNETIELLYAAGKIEITPENGIRLIEPIENKPLYEQFDQTGRVTENTDTGIPVSENQAQITKTEPNTIGNADGNTSVDGKKQEPGIITPPKPPEFTPQERSDVAQASGLTQGSVSAEQQRRDAGEYTKDGSTYKRQPVFADDAPTGLKGRVKFADAEQPDFTYRLIPSGKLQPAHINGTPNPETFLPEAQPKGRTDAASVKSADKIAGNINFGELGENPLAYSGAPTTNSRGEVIQGHNRSAAIKIHYGQGGTAYKEELKKNAAKFGFTPEQIDAMPDPVLVRALDVDDEKAIELGNYESSDVESGGTHRIDPVKVSGRVPHEAKGTILADVFLNADDDASLNQLIRDNDTRISQHLSQYLTDTQQQSLFNDKGQLTPKGVKDVEELFTHFLFTNGGHDLPDKFEQIPHAAQRGLIASLPKIFGVPADASLVPEIQGAIKAATEFYGTGINSIENWANQPDILGAGLAPKEVYTPAEIELAKRFIAAKSQKDIKEIFGDYARLVNGTEADLFGEAVPGLDKAAAVKQAFGVEHEERKYDKSNTGRASDQKPDRDSGREKDSGSADVQETGRQTGASPDAGTTSLSKPDTRSDQSPSVAEPPTLRAEQSIPERRPPVTEHLSPLMEARVLYALERKMPVGDIAQRYGLTAEEVNAVEKLPAVGSGGQMSYKLYQNFLPSKTGTDAERAEKVELINDLAAELNLPDARVSRSTPTADLKTAFDLERLTIARLYNKDRGSHMTREDWLDFLDTHGDRLANNTILSILDAFEHQTAHAEKVTEFIADQNLERLITELDDKFGLENLRELQDAPKDIRDKILTVGKTYGLKRHAIHQAFRRSFLDYSQEKSAERRERRTGPQGQTPGQTQTAALGSRKPKELDDDIQFARDDFGAAPQTDTAAFKKWFGDSKVLDENGEPLVVYHGTTHDFDTFDADRTNIENHFGKGIYLTDSAADVAENYAGEGPDLTQRIEREAENIFQDLDKDYKYGTPAYDRAMKKARDEAKRKIAGPSDGMTMPVYAKIENPVYIGIDGERTFIDGSMESFDEPEPEQYDDDFNETQEWIDWDERRDEFEESRYDVESPIIEAIQKASYQYDEIDLDKIYEDLLEFAVEGGTADELDAKLRNSEGVIYATDDEGNLASYDFIKEVFRNLGYDGIIMNADQAFGSGRTSGKQMTMDYGTKHYIVFESKQVKSAIGNNGEFNPYDNNILKSGIPGQVDLWGNATEIHALQPDLFQTQLTAKDEAKIAKDRIESVKKPVDAETVDFLVKLEEGSQDKKVAVTATNILDGIVRIQNFAMGYDIPQAARRAVEDATDALDVFQNARSLDTPIEQLLPQQDFSGKTYKERLTPQALEFVRAMESGTFAKTFQTATLKSSDDEILQMVAWHGSPHTFDKFDVSKIGTGEGAQAYGHGLYFTDKEAVADHYQRALTYKQDKILDRDGNPVPERFNISNADGRAQYIFKDLKGDVDRAIEGIKDATKDGKITSLQHLGTANDRYIPKADAVIAELQRMKQEGYIYQGRGAKYRVDLKPEADEYLLWDKPLSEQSEKVKKALRQAVDAGAFAAYDLTNPSIAGSLAYHAIAEHQDAKLRDDWVKRRNDALTKSGNKITPEVEAVLADNPKSEKLASDYLKSLGIRGIKYLDGSSRGKGEGSYNYVIFDDADVEITEIMKSVIPTFYSQLERTIGAKMPKRASADQVRGILKDTKSEERDWLGIDQYLDDNPVVKRDDLLAFVRENQVEVKDVVKGGESDTYDFPKLKRVLDSTGEAWGVRGVGLYKRGDDYLVIHNGSTRVTSSDFADVQDWIENSGEISSPDTTKFGTYALPGGENYRELLLTMPEKDSGIERTPTLRQNARGKWAWFYGEVQDTGAFVTREEAEAAKPQMRSARAHDKTNYRSRHFDEPNILAHVRFDDRDGGKTLHIAEVQSDWHQAGREKGYKGDKPRKFEGNKITTSDVKVTEFSDTYSGQIGERFMTVRKTDQINTIEKAKDFLAKTYNDEIDQTNSKLSEEHSRNAVPDAPFKKSWHELAMKKMIRYAAENGYERITWDTGATQNDRYDLSKQIDSVRWQKITADGYRIEVYKGGQELSETLGLPSVVPVEKIADYLGKDVKDRIVNSEARSGTLKGDNLKIAGTGMTGFYDKILPAFVNKYVKKWGGKVENDRLQTSETPTHKPVRVIENRSGWGGRYTIEMEGTDDTWGVYQSKADAEEFLEKLQTGEFGYRPQVHSLTITPEMKASVMQGQPLFDLSAEESQKAKRMFRRVGILTADELIRQAEFGISDQGVLEARNMPALVLVQEGVKSLGSQHGGHFSGAYFMPGAAKKFRTAMNAARDNSFASGEKENAKALAKAVAMIDLAMDPERPDLTFAINIPQLPELSKHTVQEELNHRNNSRSGARDIFADITITPAIEDELNSLGEGYQGIGLTNALDEVFAKSLRDDAPIKNQVEVWNTLLDALDTAGIDVNNYVAVASKISGTGRRFAEHAKNKSNKRAIETQLGGETETRSAAGNPQAIRETGTRGRPDARYLGRNGDSTGLRQIQLSQTDQGGDRGVAKQTDTPAFKNWFKDSKVVDESGEPLVVYHGTTADIEKFNADTTKTAQYFGKGTYFTDADYQASGYAGEKDGANVLPVYLSLQNPFIEGESKFNKGVPLNATQVRPDLIQKEYKKNGYDGIVLQRGWFIAFDSNQIKSAIGNDGNFDPKEDSIVLSVTEQKYIALKTKGQPELAKALTDEIRFARMADDDKMTIKDWVLDIASIPKSLKSSIDLSGFRQGGLTSLAHPVIAKRAFMKQLKMVLPGSGARNFEKFERDLNLHPFIEMAEDSGLYLATLAGEAIAEREESFMSGLLGEKDFFKNAGAEGARKLLSYPVRASQRAFQTFLDDLRINTFAALAKKLHESNVRAGREDDPEQYKALATFINYSTGRGDLGSFNGAAPYFNAAFFSARYWASRLQVMNPAFYAKLPPGARAIVLQDLFTTIAAMGLIMLLLKLAGGKIELDDPNDPDTLKVGFGKHTYDMSFGLLKHLRYAARMVMATQDKDPMGKMEYLTERYVRSSIAPTPGAIINAYGGKNYVGEPTDWTTEGIGLFKPIMIDNFVDAARLDGTAGVIKTVPEFFGISTSRYKDADELREILAKETAKFETAKTPAEVAEIKRRVKIWRSLIKRAGKYEKPEVPTTEPDQ